MYAFALPWPYSTLAVYGGLIAATLAATDASRSPYIAGAGLVVAAVWVWSAAYYLIVFEAGPIWGYALANALAFGYFFWGAYRSGAQHKRMHQILMWTMFLAFSLYLLKVFESVISFGEAVTGHWGYYFALNRIFDVSLVVLIVYSRLRVHAYRDPKRWRENRAAVARWEERRPITTVFETIIGKISKPLRPGRDKAADKDKSDRTDTSSQK